MTVKQPKRSTGFTLLEILIAMLIVSIGLLGVATLQIRGQQFNQVSYFRTQATFLAYDLMDRIRVNYKMNGANMESYNNNECQSKPTTLDSSCDDAACNSKALKNYDLNNICYYAREILPQGRVSIRPDATVINKYHITIYWKNILDGKEGIEEYSPEWELQL